jgi:hypothetical protein
MTQTDHTTGSTASLTEHAVDGQGRDDAGVLLAPFSVRRWAPAFKAIEASERAKVGDRWSSAVRSRGRVIDKNGYA